MKYRINPVFIKAGAAAAAGIICFTAVYAWDNTREVDTNEQGQKILKRNSHGKGERNSTLNAYINGKEESVDITVSEEMYREEEIRKIFEESGKVLENLILGENKSLEEVRTDLNFPDEIPDTGISVSWESGDHKIIDLQGKVHNQDTPEDGTLVRLTASLSYGEEKASHEFFVRVMPEKVSESQKLMDDLNRALIASDQETRTEEYMVLPEKIGDTEILWSPRKENRAYAVLAVGIGAALMICVSDNQKKKEKEKKKIIQMERDYPQIINKFNLYIGAGMTIRKAWFCIAENYLDTKEKYGQRPAYEEMVYTMNKIQSGAAEGECYEEYGIRCGITVYRKFGTVLSQNLRKGSRGITDLLRKESEEAFEERKNRAKKLGEEAGTKMMIPLFMMLIVVFAIVIIPALFSVQM